MDDAPLMRRFEGLGDLLRDGKCLVKRNRPLRDTVGERRPLDQFEDKRPDDPLPALSGVEGWASSSP